MGCGHRTVEINAAAGVFDDRNFEACLARIFRRIADAEVECEPGYKHGLQFTFSQVTQEAGRRLVVVFVKRRE